MKIGSLVIFDWKVFEPPYIPYYDAYKDHTFKIIDCHYQSTHPHFELKCISDPKVKVAGYVHPEELIEV